MDFLKKGLWWQILSFPESFAKFIKTHFLLHSKPDRGEGMISKK